MLVVVRVQPALGDEVLFHVHLLLQAEVADQVPALLNTPSLGGRLAHRTLVEDVGGFGQHNGAVILQQPLVKLLQQAPAGCACR